MRTRSLARAAGAAVLGLVAPSPSSALAAGRVLTVDDAVEMALHAGGDLRAAEAMTRADRALAQAAGSKMLPSVKLTDEFDHWDRAFALTFGSLSATVHEQDTNTFTALADQPLVGLAHLARERSAQERSADAGEAAQAAAREQLKASVEVGFLEYFEASAMAQIARTSEAELSEEVQITKAKVDAGVSTNADLLRVQVAVANAKQQEIVAHTQGAVVRAKLLGVMGLQVDGSDVEFAEPTRLLAQGRAAVPSSTEAQQQALASRPEVRQRGLQIEAADHTYRARQMSMLPEVDAEAGYNRLDGQPFSPTNAAFVGLKLSWPVWEWGASYFAQRAAGEQVEASRILLAAERQRIRVEVASDLAQAQAASSAVELAEQTITSAEEAYRVTGALLKAGSATTTDVLATQSELTQARLNRTRAEYEQAIAQVNLARTLGR